MPPLRAAFFIPAKAGAVTLLYEYTSHRVFTSRRYDDTFIQTLNYV